MNTNVTNVDNLVTAIFPDRSSAEAAIQASYARGYSRDDIDMVMSDDTKARYFPNDDVSDSTDLGHKAAEGAGVGGAIGGTVGAVLAAIAAVGTSLALPGLGLVIAGPLAAAAAGAGVGAAGGGLLGALIGWKIPEDRVQSYEEAIKSGGILLGVHAKSAEDAQYLEQAWSHNNAQLAYFR